MRPPRRAIVALGLATVGGVVLVYLLTGAAADPTQSGPAPTPDVTSTPDGTPTTSGGALSDGPGTEATLPIELSVGPRELSSGTLTPGEPLDIDVRFRVNDVEHPVTDGSYRGRLVVVGANLSHSERRVLWNGTIEPGGWHQFDVRATPTASNSSVRVRFEVPERPSATVETDVVVPDPTSTPVPDDGQEGYPANGTAS